MVLYGLLYVEGLALSHRSAYHTLENLRLHLQSKLEKQPLGAIQERGALEFGRRCSLTTSSMELLLAPPCRKGCPIWRCRWWYLWPCSSTDWKLGLLSLCSLPLGVLAMGMMYRSGMSKMGRLLRRRAENEQHHVEYINGMEVVKVFQPGRRVLSPL